jgi:cystathionine beta-synthase
MIEAAERDGRLKSGGLVVEATAGNTGLGLALACAAKGYRLILVIPDKMALEKINHLRSMGAEIQITRSDVGKGHPEYYQDVAQRLANEHGGFFVNQFASDLIHSITGPSPSCSAISWALSAVARLSWRVKGAGEVEKA